MTDIKNIPQKNIEALIAISNSFIEKENKKLEQSEELRQIEASGGIIKKKQ